MNEEFKALEDKIDSKLESYRKEIHKLAQEPITSSWTIVIRHVVVVRSLAALNNPVHVPLR